MSELMGLHKEIKLEDEICDHLAEHGWMYAASDAAEYDRELALYPPDVIGWVQETQPEVCETLQQQARSNSEQQFANSPDLNTEIVNAIIDALDAHEQMSTQALDSDDVRAGLKEILLGPAKLYEMLRGDAA